MAITIFMTETKMNAVTLNCSRFRNTVESFQASGLLRKPRTAFINRLLLLPETDLYDNSRSPSSEYGNTGPGCLN